MCTALIFKSGKIVLAGTKSQNDVTTAAKKFVDLLSVEIINFNDSQRSLSSGIRVDENAKPVIHNMVAVGDCKFPIRLEGLSIDHIEATTVNNLFVIFNMQYEPELFSGLIYHMKNPKVVLLIFVSGKVVVTGAKV